MLQSIYIQNYALIDTLDLPTPPFPLVTVIILAELSFD